MKLRLKYSGYFVSAFLITSLLIVIISIVLLGIDKRYFSTKYYYHTTLKNAVGLSNSTPVTFKGFNIGKVSDYSLNENNMVDVKVEIYEEYKNKIVVNSLIKKSINPFTGNATLEFLENLRSKKINEEDSFIASLDTPEGEKIFIEQSISESGDILFSIITNLNDILDGMNRRDKMPEGVLYTAVENMALASESMMSFTENINKTINRIGTGDTPSLTEVLSAFSKLNYEMTKAATHLDETLFLTDSLLINYSDPTSLGQKIIDPTGDKLINPLSESIKQLNKLLHGHIKFIEYLNSQTSEMSGTLLNLNQTMIKMQQMMEGMERNPLLNFGGSKKPEHFNSGQKIRN